MTPQLLRRLSGLTQAQVAIRMGWTLRTIKLAEGMPLEAWSVGELRRYAWACGHSIKIIAVDDGSEKELT